MRVHLQVDEHMQDEPCTTLHLILELDFLPFIGMPFYLLGDAYDPWSAQYICYDAHMHWVDVLFPENGWTPDECSQFDELISDLKAAGWSEECPT